MKGSATLILTAFFSMFLIFESATARSLKDQIRLLPQINHQLSNGMNPREIKCSTSESPFVLRLENEPSLSHEATDSKRRPWHISPTRFYSELDEFKYMDQLEEVPDRKDFDAFNKNLIKIYNRLREFANSDGSTQVLEGKRFWIEPDKEEVDDQYEGPCKMSIEFLDDENPMQRHLVVRVDAGEVSGQMSVTPILDPGTREGGVKVQANPLVQIHSNEGSQNLATGNQEDFEFLIEENEISIKDKEKVNPTFRLEFENGAPVGVRFPLRNRSDNRGYTICRFPRLF